MDDGRMLRFHRTGVGKTDRHCQVTVIVLGFIGFEADNVQAPEKSGQRSAATNPRVQLQKFSPRGESRFRVGHLGAPLAPLT